MVRNVTRGSVLARAAGTATSPWARLRGLIGYAALPPGGGLIFPGERGVHTLFMRFPIDLVFYGRELEVLDVVEALPPWRFSPYRWRAAGVIELPAGAARAAATRPGDVLSVG